MRGWEGPRGHPGVRGAEGIVLDPEDARRLLQQARTETRLIDAATHRRRVWWFVAIIAAAIIVLIWSLDHA